jgi:hypothetical protein
MQRAILAQRTYAPARPWLAVVAMNAALFAQS